jgi:cell division protein FtsW (lipid II flippase)
MPEERSGRKRRRSRRRRGGGGGAPEETGEATKTAGRKAPSLPDWNWRTFPVFFAFALGVFLMGLLGALPDVGPALFFISLGGVAFGLAHILTRQVIARWRR